MTLTLDQDQRSTLIEIDLDGFLYAVTFSPDGQYVVGSDREKVRVWQVKDGEEMGTMKASRRCSGVTRRLAVRVGRKDIRTSLESKGNQQVHLRSRFLARLGTTRCRNELWGHRLGLGDLQTSANTPPWRVESGGSRSKILAARRSYRGSHP